MILEPMDIRKVHPIRKSKQQKLVFRNDVMLYAESLGYAPKVEEGRFGARNILLGDPEKAKYLVTAHYDTPAQLLLPNFSTPTNGFLTRLKLFSRILFFSFCCGFGGYLMGTGRVLPGAVLYALPFASILLALLGPANQNNANDNTSGVVTVLEIARTLPENLRDKVCFVLFDLEEAGLIGSASHRKAHKAVTENQIVMNLDCVGDGDEIYFFPMKKFRRDGSKLKWLYQAIGRYGDKTIDVREKGFISYASDQKNFPYGVGIAALQPNKWIGPYLSRIHTDKDTVLDQTNVNLLRACITSLIASDPEQDISKK